MILKALQVGPFMSNCYVVGCEKTRQGLIVDPGADPEVILGVVKQHGLTVSTIVATHCHIDHVSALAPVKAGTSAAFALHELDSEGLKRSLARLDSRPGLAAAFEPDRLLHDGDAVQAGELSFKVLHTPGHSPGGLCLYGHGALFCGDTLFNFSIGRADMPGCSYETLLESIKTKLLALPDETRAYPGHGPATTIGVEREWNPFLKDGAFM